MILEAGEKISTARAESSTLESSFWALADQYSASASVFWPGRLGSSDGGVGRRHADGDFPVSGLIADAAGNLYSTTGGGGNTSAPNCVFNGCGVVFKLDRSGNETVLYTFTGGADGSGPSAGLVRDAAGNLYGTTT